MICFYFNEDSCPKVDNVIVNVGFQDASSLQKEEAGYFLHQSTLILTSIGKFGSCDGGSV